VPSEPYSRTYTLTTNYRSSRTIVDKSRRLIDNNRRRVSKDIHPADDAEPGEVRYVSVAGWRQRTDEVVRFLKDQHEATDRWSSLAVLCRFKAQQPLLALALDEADIPRSPLLTYRLFSDPSVRLLRAYVDLVRNPKVLDPDTVRGLLNRPNRYLSNEFIDRVVRAASPWDELSRSAGEDGAPRGATDLVRRASSLRKKYQVQKPSSLELLDDVLLTFGLETYWKDEASPAARPDEGDPLQLVDLIRFHAAEMVDPGELLDYWDVRAKSEDTRCDLGSDPLDREETPSEDQVVIGTLHSSKGREYEGVVLFDYDVDLTRLDDHEVEEERRVFYVGLTRARSAALFTIDAEKGTLHPFIRETIAPAEREEQEAIQTRVRELRRMEQELVVDRTRLAARIEAIISGAELAEQEAAQRALAKAVEEKQESLAELEAYLGQGGPKGLLRRLLGRHGRASAEVEASRQALSEARDSFEEAEGRILLLRGDPELAAEPVREEASIVATKLAAVRRKASSSRARLAELDLAQAASDDSAV
jgi:superfamily I DNA/RNA helicase